MPQGGTKERHETWMSNLHTMPILVDTRERDPYEFNNIAKAKVGFTVIRETLSTGDYSTRNDLLARVENQIAIERKTLADLYGSVGQARDRFEREFQRLAQFGFAALVIEADFTQILCPNFHLKHPTAMRPRAVLATLFAWCQRYRVHLFPCPDRAFAELLTFRLLERWFRDHVEPANGRKHLGSS